MNWLKKLFSGKKTAEKGNNALRVGTQIYLQGEFEQALPWLEKALIESSMEGDGLLEGVARTRLAWLFADLGHVEEAFQHAKEALPLVRKYKQNEVEIDTLLILGALYNGQGKVSEAIKHYQDSVELTRKVIVQKGSTIGLRANQLNGVTSLASLHLRINQTEHAFRLIEEGRDIAKEVEAFWRSGGQPEDVLGQASLMARRVGMFHLVACDVLIRKGDTSGAKREAEMARKIGQDDQDTFLIHGSTSRLMKLDSR